MSATMLIARHEWRRQLVQPWLWTLVALVVALAAYDFLLALQGYLQLAPKLGALDNAPGVTDLVAIPLLRALANLLLLIVPLIAMRAIAGERRAQTLPLLLAAGVGDARIVVGKFLGALGPVLAIVVLVAAMPAALAGGTALDVGKLLAALLGLALYAAALTAIGVLASSWASQPVLAAGAAFAISTVLAMIDAGARFQGIENASINYLALPTHLEPFFRGVIASVDIVYFALVVALALALAARRVGALRSRAE